MFLVANKLNELLCIHYHHIPISYFDFTHAEFTLPFKYTKCKTCIKEHPVSEENLVSVSANKTNWHNILNFASSLRKPPSGKTPNFSGFELLHIIENTASFSKNCQPPIYIPELKNMVIPRGERTILINAEGKPKILKSFGGESDNIEIFQYKK